MMTNFHLPRSTLFMLVAAFCGLEVMRRAYAHAIARELSILLLRRRLPAVSALGIPQTQGKHSPSSYGQVACTNMPDVFSFRLLATDGAARRGEITTPHGSVAHAGVHAGRHAGHGQRPDAGCGACNRRRHRACQYLSPDAAAGRRAHRGARRAAHIHELAARHPDRFRRLPSHVAVATAQGRGQAA